MAAIACYYR